jgi:hypothetical protein
MAIAFDNATPPAIALSVAVAPPSRRSAVRAARVSLTRATPLPSRTARLPRRGRPRRAAVLDETTSALLLRQSPSQPESTASRPAEASATESSVETTAKSGGGSPAAARVTGALDPTLPAASVWRALTV